MSLSCRVIGTLIIFFFLPFKNVYAVTVSIPSYPSAITSEPFTITASVSGATTATNYLRIDIFKDGTNNYFGETYNGSDWYGGSTFSQYYQISVVTGTYWSGNIQGRIGSPTNTDYDGTGTYKIRVRRYTSSGGYTSSEASASAVTVAISVPTATPTPAPATSTPTSTIAPTTSPTSTKSPTPTLKIASISASATISSLPTSVFGQSSESTMVEENSPMVAGESTQAFNLGYLLITVGAILLTGCGILVYRNYKKSKEIL